MKARGRTLLGCLMALTIMCACNSNFDDTSAPVWLSVNSIEPSSDPFGDVYDSSTGTFMPDTVTVKLQADFKNQNAPPTGSSYTTIQIDRYTVTYSRTDDGVEVPAGFGQSLSVQVVAGEENTEVENLVICRADQKLQPPLVYLTPLSYGFEPDTGYTSIACNCTIEFFGHTLAGEPIYASGGIGINFADYAN